MKKFVDYYRIFGVKETAALADIRTAYVRLAKRHHPDKGGSAAKMHIINEAYETLKNPTSRAEFDRRRAALRAQPVSATAPERVVDEQEVMKAAKKRARRFRNLGVLWLVLAISVVCLAVIGLHVRPLLLWLALPPAIYGAGLLAYGLYSTFYPQTLVQKAYHRFLTSYKLSPAKKTASVLKTAASMAIILLIVSSGVWLLIEKDQTGQDLTAEKGVSQEYQSQLADLSVLKKQHDGCQKEFSQLNSRLNEVNQKLSRASAEADTSTHNELVPVQNQLVTDYNNKRSECGKLKEQYNQQVSSLSKPE